MSLSYISVFNNSWKPAKIAAYSVFFFRLSKSGKKNFRVCWSGPERHIFVSPVDWFRWSLIRSEWRAYFENQSIILNQCSVSSKRLFDHPHKDFCRSLRPWGDGRWNDLVFHNGLFQSKTDCLTPSEWCLTRIVKQKHEYEHMCPKLTRIAELVLAMAWKGGLQSKNRLEKPSKKRYFGRNDALNS